MNIIIEIKYLVKCPIDPLIDGPKNQPRSFNLFQNSKKLVHQRIYLLIPFHWMCDVTIFIPQSQEAHSMFSYLHDNFILRMASSGE